MITITIAHAHKLAKLQNEQLLPTEAQQQLKELIHTAEKHHRRQLQFREAVQNTIREPSEQYIALQRIKPHLPPLYKYGTAQDIKKWYGLTYKVINSEQRAAMKQRKLNTTNLIDINSFIYS